MSRTSTRRVEDAPRLVADVVAGSRVDLRPHVLVRELHAGGLRRRQDLASARLADGAWSRRKRLTRGAPTGASGGWSRGGFPGSCRSGRRRFSILGRPLRPPTFPETSHYWYVPKDTRVPLIGITTGGGGRSRRAQEQTVQTPQTHLVPPPSPRSFFFVWTRPCAATAGRRAILDRLPARTELIRGCAAG